MAYTDIASVRGRIPQCTVAQFSDANVNLVLADTEKEVQNMVRNICGTVAPLPATVPYDIIELAVYAACEECLVRLYAPVRHPDAADVTFWHDRKVKKFKEIKMGRTALPLLKGFETNKDKSDLKPLLGLGEHGERLTTDTAPTPSINDYEVQEDP